MLTFENDVTKAFQKNEGKLIALLKGNPSSKTKIKNDRVSSLIDELIHDRKIEVETEFKAKAKSIIDSKINFDKFVNQKQKEFEEAITNKLKEFNKEMEDIFKMIQDVEELRKSYEDTLLKNIQPSSEIIVPES